MKPQRPPVVDPGILLGLDPVPKLLARVRGELSSDFSAHRPIRVSRAPGRLDVMGGIADYTGSLVCEIPLDRAAAVGLQLRQDRNVQVFSFNLLDDHRPFTLRIPLDALADSPIQTLRREFAEPGRKWAGYLAGCLAIMQKRGLIDLKNPDLRGVNLALLSSVPLGAGVSSSAAIEVAAMMNLMDHYGVARDDPMLLASLCQEVEQQVVGAPCGIMDQASSCAGQKSSLLRMVCQPHELQPPLKLPEGVRVVGINSNVKHSVGGGMYPLTRCAAFMGHKIILEKMRELGSAQGQTLVADPMRGYLANLDPEDYKRLFRPYLPEQMNGKDFAQRWGATIDTATTVDPNQSYHIRQACDHHVLEARRVRNFAGYLENLAADPAQRKLGLDKAGHLMYASHLSYTNDALLGALECDLLVKLVRDREAKGFYGAKITGGGAGGTVAILADISGKSDEALAEIMQQYQQQTGKVPEAFRGSSPGAWALGTAEVDLANLP